MAQFNIRPDQFQGVGIANASAPTYAEGQQVPTASVDLNGNVRVTSSNPGGPITVVDGGDVTQGAIADIAVIGDTSGTISAKLRGISKILNSVWSSVNGWLVVSANQAGSWVLSAGSAIIGQVQLAGSSTILSGQLAVTATAQALPSNACKAVTIKAFNANVIAIYVGPSGVTDATGYEMDSGDTLTMPVNNTNLLYFIASTTGASISWIAQN